MKDFTGVCFQGKFRSYQQRVLDQSELFLKDKKIHIVAAPGSGKTILGLELIRRLNHSCIILSPTQTIRDQWIERFKTSYLPADESILDYTSTNLNQIRLINSITYQALYAAMNKVKLLTEEEEVDYSALDLFQLIHRMDIQTICLDEAHHLQNEWQKALELFVNGLDKSVTMISLTATPPYDAKPKEWNRYISMCGPIDDEIFVPELVKEKTLCPHQDYILFNYPEQQEIESLASYRLNVLKALEEIGDLSFLGALNEQLEEFYRVKQEYFYEHFKSVVALMIFLNSIGYKIKKSLFQKLTYGKAVPSFNLSFAQTAIEFLISSEWVSEANQFRIIEILKKYEVYERNQPALLCKDSLKRNLVSSSGKLHSITRIVKCEAENLKEKLRLLILTDNIRKEALAQVGQNALNHISIVSIFDELNTHTTLRLGCLSGSLVILPMECIDKLPSYDIDSSKLSYKRISDTQYAQIEFNSNRKQKVQFVTKLFEEGRIQVLIGTQALLGEGWDSPCINSLILASYVGSFMLSNQMRGRAIRVNPKDVEKTANIWHLVTLEPEYVFEENVFKRIQAKMNEDHTKIISYDYETLVRRFDCFLGPNYDTEEIESGIDRVTLLKPPFDKKNIEKINEEMLLRSCKRTELRNQWECVLEESVKTVTETSIPKDYRVPSFTYFNFIGLFLAGIIEGTFIQGIVSLIRTSLQMELKILGLVFLNLCILLFGFCMGLIVRFIYRHSSPKKIITSLSTAILQTFKEVDLIHTGAHLRVDADKLDIGVNVYLSNATLHEQNLFNKAITELLSPMQNPKFIIIRKGILHHRDYRYSFACPSVFSKEDAKILNKFLEKSISRMDLVYTYNEKGRKILLKCKKKSFITKNQEIIMGKQKVSKYE